MDNGEVKTLVKNCPIWRKPCQEVCPDCSLLTEIVRNVSGLTQKGNICAFSALVIMISELNAKMPVPTQKFQLPPLLRG